MKISIDLNTLWNIILLFILLVSMTRSIGRGNSIWTALATFFGGWWLAKLFGFKP